MTGLEAWLLARLAPPAGKKLADLALGTPQQRVLDSAAVEAIKVTARHFHPDDPSEAEQLERVPGARQLSNVIHQRIVDRDLTWTHKGSAGPTGHPAPASRGTTGT